MNFERQFGKPEDRLILCCARTEPATKIWDQIDYLLSQQLDWDYILARAVQQSVFPLLYRNLKGARRYCPDENAFSELQARCRLNAFYAQHLETELFTILNIFADSGARAIPMKGPVLAEVAYGGAALRVCSDLDILSPVTDANLARDALLSIGYRGEAHYLSDWQQQWLFQSRECYSFWKEDRRSRLRINVDLHFNLVPRCLSINIDPQALFDRAEIVTVNGRAVSCLSPEDTLIYLCVHAWKHGWTLLKWICDIAQFARSARGRVDWDKLIERTSSLGIEGIVYSSFHLAAELLREDSLRGPAQKLAGKSCGKGLPWPTSTLAFSAKAQLSVLEQLSLMLAYRRGIRSIADLIRTASRPCAYDLSLALLPRRFFFIYYLIRLLRLSAKYGRAVLKALAHVSLDCVKTLTRHMRCGRQR